MLITLHNHHCGCLVTQESQYVMVYADIGQEEAMSQFGSSPRFKQTLARWTLQQVVGVSYLGAGGSAGYL